MTAVRYESRAPSPALARFVEAFWVYEGPARPHALERIMPTGAAQLIVNLADDRVRIYDPENPGRCHEMGGVVLSGTHDRYTVIDTAEQQRVFGVTFRAGGTFPFLDAPAFETANAHVPLDLLWPRRRVASLRERVLEARTPSAALDAGEDELFHAMLDRDVHPAVSSAIAAFSRRPGVTTIAEVARTIGLSPKRFIERFRNEVGLTPKVFCRVRRFQRALACAHAGRPVDWAAIAAGAGYFDQPHFIHDFRAFSGVTPTAYRASRTEFRNHVKFLQSTGVRI